MGPKELLRDWRIVPASVATFGTHLSAVGASRAFAFGQSVVTGLAVYLLLHAVGVLWARTGFDWLDVSRWVPAVAATLATVIAAVVAVEVGAESTALTGPLVIFGLVIYGSLLLVALSLGALAVRRVRSLLPWATE